MALILQAGFESVVRSLLGAKVSELPDPDINQRLVLDLAESIVIKRVPSYATLTDPVDLIHLESAVISYMCHLLSRSMARRVNIEVQTVDLKWKKDKVDWGEMAEAFLADYENAINQISTVVIDYGTDSTLVGVIVRSADTSGADSA